MVAQYFRDKTFGVLMGSTHPAYSIATFDTEEKDFRETHWDIKKDDVVFDIGASYGAYTLAACSMEAIVYTFEPEKSVYGDLVANINLNNWSDRCFPQNAGLWSSDTTVNMKDYAPHWPPQTITTDYNVKTIDQVVLENNIQKIDWIKIDVEGAEEHVVQGGLASIAKFKPNMIIECHTFLDAELCNKIKALLEPLNLYTFEEIDRDPCVMLLVKPKDK